MLFPGLPVTTTKYIRKEFNCCSSIGVVDEGVPSIETIFFIVLQSLGTCNAYFLARLYVSTRTRNGSCWWAEVVTHVPCGEALMSWLDVS